MIKTIKTAVILLATLLLAWLLPWFYIAVVVALHPLQLRDA